MPTLRIFNRSPHPLPAYASEGAAGLDLCAWLEAPLTLGPLERTRVPTGIHLQIPGGYEVQIRPRSGLAWRQGLTVLNSPGTIDSDYRGEIQVLLVNLSSEACVIESGMRIAQMVLAPVAPVAWQAVDTLADLDTTPRGAGGFGHTGSQM